MAFLAPQGQPPVYDAGKRPNIGLAHLTSVPPFITNFHHAFRAHQTFMRSALSNERVRTVTRKSDVQDAQARIGLLFGMQNAPEAMTLERVRALANEGLIFMALAYEGATEYGDGFKGEGPLTKRGKDLLQWMAACGMTLDVSHLGHRTARDALAFIRNERLPMIPLASHSGCLAVFNHPRNVPDDILRTLADMHGYVGIPALSCLVAPEGEPPLVLIGNHLAHAAGICGWESIGIGSDCVHCDMTMKEARALFDWLMERIEPIGAYFPDRAPALIKRGSRMFEILQKNLRRFNDKGQELICGRNFEAYLHRALPR